MSIEFEELFPRVAEWAVAGLRTLVIRFGGLTMAVERLEIRNKEMEKQIMDLRNNQRHFNSELVKRHKEIEAMKIEIRTLKGSLTRLKSKVRRTPVFHG